MYKVSNNISPTTLNYIFASRATPYKPISFKIQKVHLVYNGTESLSHLGLLQDMS